MPMFSSGVQDKREYETTCKIGDSYISRLVIFILFIMTNNIITIWVFISKINLGADWGLVKPSCKESVSTFLNLD